MRWISCDKLIKDLLQDLQFTQRESEITFSLSSFPNLSLRRSLRHNRQASRSVFFPKYRLFDAQKVGSCVAIY